MFGVELRCDTDCERIHHETLFVVSLQNRYSIFDAPRPPKIPTLLVVPVVYGGSVAIVGIGGTVACVTIYHDIPISKKANSLNNQNNHTALQRYFL